MFTCSLHFYASSNQYSQCFDSLCFIHIKAGSILNDIQQSIYLDDDLSEITPTLGAYQSQVSEVFLLNNNIKVLHVNVASKNLINEGSCVIY